MDNQSYVFISYAHKDADAVVPCIEAMKQSGIRLWYDDGIEAGSEWPEFIAEKVVNCTKFVLFVSSAYLDSQNCKRELNFAISRKKDILSVYLEDVFLSPGMEMQLGTYQAIYRQRFATMEQFQKSLCCEHYFDACRLYTAKSAEPKSTSYNYAGVQQKTYSNRTFDGAGHTTASHNAGTFSPPKRVPTGTSFSGSVVALPRRSRIIACLLAFFLGAFGVQKFYLRQPKKGVLYLVFCFTYIPFVLSILELFSLLFSSDEKLQKKYNCSFIW